MKGLDLAEQYFRALGAPLLREHFPQLEGRIAAGLVGPGSECFGYDDEVSRDHDWGPGFCLWLVPEDLRRIGPMLQEQYDRLPAVYAGFGPRLASPGEEWRVGVIEVGAFYARNTGRGTLPVSATDWLAIAEDSLAACTNGRVFTDPLGEFSRRRTALLDYYPEDARLKKIASRCITAAQSGQYNYARSLRRNERFAAAYALAQFCTDAMSLLFLLNRRFAPFSKWLHRATKDLPRRGAAVHAIVGELQSEADGRERAAGIEELCALIAGELREQNLSDCRGDFLLDHAHSVHGRIAEPLLRERLTVVR